MKILQVGVSFLPGQFKLSVIMLIVVKFAAVFMFTIGFLFPLDGFYAQTAQIDVPYYVVEEGDTLWGIAARFGVSFTDLQDINGMQDQDILSPGRELLIPGLSGYSGPVDTVEISLGETLGSFSRWYRVPKNMIARLNHLVTPAELFVGRQLILPVENIAAAGASRDWIQSGENLLEIAVRNGENPWRLLLENELNNAWRLLPGEVLTVNQENEVLQEQPEAFFDFPEVIQNIALQPILPAQGKTTVVRVTTGVDVNISGTLAGEELHFFPIENEYIALQGIHALQEPGLYPLILKFADTPDDENYFVFSQSVLIQPGDYTFDPPLIVEPETIDPAVTILEDKLWQQLGQEATAEKMWEGLFASPVPAEFTGCWTSFFGNRRSYNGGPYESFHSGLDLCGGIGTELFAPAAGEVIFAGPLTVRGNATVIDHGWGVYTAYDHQSEIVVEVGERVTLVQLIGLGGDTGRVTGPHLHWEVWVGGVQVDPLEWLEQEYP